MSKISNEYQKELSDNFDHFWKKLTEHPKVVISEHVFISPAILSIVDYDFIIKCFDESGVNREMFGDIKPQELCFSVIRNFLQALIDAKKGIKNAN
jgi:hypothetical protein